jgi:5'-deoxynucleotidase YfbR-like HD superfamily hydrolase
MTTPLASVPREPYKVMPGGETVYLLRPEASPIALSTIAHCLAITARFDGGTRYPYSVAEHSVHVMHLAGKATGGDRECMRAALLHDAHEAYIGDATSPVQRALAELGGGSAFRALDAMWSARIRQAFDVSWDGRIQAVVKAADYRALMTERHALMPESPAWPDMPEDERDDEWFVRRGGRLAPYHRGWMGYRDLFLDAASRLGVV